MPNRDEIQIRSGKAKLDRLQSRLAGQKTAITSMAFIGWNSELVTSGWDIDARLWETDSGKCLRFLGGQESPVVSTAISPDNRFIATGSSLGELRLFNLEIGVQIKPRFIHDAFISGDGIY